MIRKHSGTVLLATGAMTHAGAVPLSWIQWMASCVQLDVRPHQHPIACPSRAKVAQPGQIFRSTLRCQECSSEHAALECAELADGDGVAVQEDAAEVDVHVASEVHIMPLRRVEHSLSAWCRCNSS